MQIVRKTILNDEIYLRQISKEVDLSNNDYREDIKTLEKYCLENECFALSPVQIGIPKRMVYLKNTNLDVPLDDVKHNEARVLINPIVVSRKGHTKFWEACLSCLDNVGLVSRPYEIVLEYIDENEISHTKIFKGFEATVLSHELDHLDGILHTDIAEEVLHMANEEKKAYRKEHPYQIISKDCDFDIEIAQKNYKKNL